MKGSEVKPEMAFQIRRATLEDADSLTALAIRSKAHWGYSEEFMTAFKPELIIKKEYISSAPVFVATAGNGVIAGFAGLSAPGTAPELIFLFVDPLFIGMGCGESLWQSALSEALEMRWPSFQIVSDPNAEAFYVKKGAKRIGEKSFAAVPDRKVPVLRYQLCSPA